MRFPRRYLGVACVTLACALDPILACSFPDVMVAIRSPDGSADGTSAFDARIPQSEMAQPTGDATGGVAYGRSDASDGTGLAAVDGGGLADAVDLADAFEGGGGSQGDGPSDGPDNEPNCDCGTLGLYPTNAVCGLLGTGLACLSPGGFVGNPVCGQAADFITCDFGLGCSTVHSTKVQQCMPSD